MFAVSSANTTQGAKRIAASKAVPLPPAVAETVSLAEYRALEHRLELARLEVTALERIAAGRAKAVRDIEAANAALARLAGRRRTVASVAARIAKATGVTMAELMSDMRTARVVFARQAAFYWAYRVTTRTMPQIGKLLGGKDHTTVLHGVRAYPEKRATQGRRLRAISVKRGTTA